MYLRKTNQKNGLGAAHAALYNNKFDACSILTSKWKIVGDCLETEDLSIVLQEAP